MSPPKGASLALSFAGIWEAREGSSLPHRAIALKEAESLRTALSEARVCGVDPLDVVRGFVLQLLSEADAEHGESLARVRNLVREDAARALLVAANEAAERLKKTNMT